MNQREPIWPHLSFRSKVSAVYYASRSYLLLPAPSKHRCCMGGTVDPTVWCPRWVEPDSLWCAHHRREIARGQRSQR